MSSTSFEILIQGVPHSSNYERVHFPNLPNMLAYVVNLNFKLGVVLVTNTRYIFFFNKILHIGAIGFRSYSCQMPAGRGLLWPWQNFLCLD